MEKGKLPPQAPELEEVVLGALLIDQKAIEEVASVMKSKMFYKSKHQDIYTAIENLFLKNEAIDLLTVSNELKSTGNLEKVGGDYSLIQLTQQVSSSAHIDFHARIIMQKYIQRQLISNSNAITKEAYEEGTDIFELVDKAYSHLNSVTNLLIKNKEIDLRSLTEEILNHAGKLYRGEVKSGIDTPISNLTSKMGGWRDNELIILAARPGMGKTAFALKAGWVAALQNIPVGFFSLEMGANQLLSRLWSMDLRIDNEKFTKTGLSPDEEKIVVNRLTQYNQIPFYIDDTPSLTIQVLSTKAKKWKKEKGIKMIIVDYLQLMTGSKNNREQDISSISRGLKLLAKELCIPVIALSQLSRAVEQRGGNKRPMLSDLRESGAIEQDADVVQFIYRPEYYGIDEWDDDERGPTAGQAEYIVAKNRNGGLVRDRMKFEGRYTNFTNIDDFEDSELDVVQEVKPEPNFDLKNAFDSDVKLPADDDFPF